MSALTIELAELEKRVGQEIAVSPWLRIEQERIDRFADATDDHQYIHVDPERAKQSPFGGTIAHGFLTLSMLSRFLALSIDFAGRRMGVNYGLNKVRFVAPVPAGANVRARFGLLTFEKLEGGAQLVWKVTVEREGGERPCMLAEWVTRVYV